MNERQRTILVLLGAAIVAMLLFPPYVIRGGNNMVSIVIDSGYAFLFSLPPRATVEVGTLLLQWLAVAAVGGIALVLAKGATPRHDRSMSSALRSLENEAARQRTNDQQKPTNTKGADEDWGWLAGIAVVIGWFIYRWVTK